MNNFISRVRTIFPIKAFFALIIGGLLLVSQACSSVAATTPYTDKSNSGTKTTHLYNDDGKTGLKRANLYKDDGANSEVRVPKGADINSPYEGGMNNYNDADPRSKAAIDKTNAKAEYLVENAKRNLVAHDKESFSDVAERGARNVKENAKNAADNIKSTLNDVSSDVNDNVKENSQKLRDSLSNTGDAIKNAVR
jgi:gas vesicle protein